MAKILAGTLFSAALLLFFFNAEVSGRDLHLKRGDQLVSDGQVTNNAAREKVIEPSVLRLRGMDHSSEAQCEHIKNILLSGSGRIFEILGTGIFGASGFLIIAELPESLILLVTGLFSSDERAQENVLIAVGMVAGSTITNLTIIWGICLFIGRQVFLQNTNTSPPGNNSSAEIEQEKPPTLWTGYGVGSDEETSFTAKVMLVSPIPLIILLLPKIFGVPYDSREYSLDILVTLITLVVTLVAYFIYQFSHSSIQDRRLEYLKVVHQTHVLAVIQHVQECVPELVDEHGVPNEAAILSLFQKLDKDGDEQLSSSELMELFDKIRLSSESSVLNKERIIEHFSYQHEAMVKIFKDLDTDKDGEISLQEFTEGLKNWINSIGANTNQYKVDRSAVALSKAIFLLVLGIAMLAVLAEPLIYSVRKFSSSAKIPSIYAAFALVPYATTSRTALSAFGAVKQKIPKSTLLTFSEIYDAVFMNNVLGFSVLLSIVYFRGLRWHFYAEVMIVVIVCSIMGLIASFKSRLPLWIMFVAFYLYPFSAILIYFIDDNFRSP